ncbi:MAG TPA: nucleoside triphosphate pyrophosphohydrolase [Alphaproteobacteria bacterium]|nr:nucleoside triphosphate pyrophosphohydrolase [Alphaproteobacteria bacterium]
MAREAPNDLRNMDALLEIMRALRAPDGCPWDREQNFASIAPYTVEEAYEVADAIDRRDFSALKSELGDLLFQAVYHAQMAEEERLFSFADIVQSIAEKLIRRHPHVFGSAKIETAADQTAHWEVVKAAERGDAGHRSVLDDVPLALPALLRAEKLMNRAARVGFFWDRPESVIAKIREETEELVQEVERGETEKAAEEFGDVLFVLANLARHLGINPEEALRRTNAKFERRFRFLEERLREQGREVQGTSLTELEALWQEAKHAEREA